MGQPVTVLEKPSRRGGVTRYELNRVLTGTGHETYDVDSVIDGVHPADELARRLFARGGIEQVHVNANVVTVLPERGRDLAGVKEIIEDLYTYYLEGVPVPRPEDFTTPAG